MKNLLTRALSGAVYVALICASVLAGGWWFTALFTLFSLLAIVEFTRLSRMVTAHGSVVAPVVDAAGAVALTFGLTSWWSGQMMVWPLAAYLGYLVVRMCCQVLAGGANKLETFAFSCMGQIYIALPLGLLGLYYTLPAGGFLLLAMFIMIWLSDTGAYLVGSLIGRHKMCPSISPGKTWEGFAGGVTFAIGSAFVFKLCFPASYTMISLPALCGMGLVVALAATIGDLVESQLKRTLKVKDSGSLMPGHGGILDRIDSLLLVAPASLLYLLAIGIL